MKEKTKVIAGALLCVLLVALSPLHAGNQMDADLDDGKILVEIDYGEVLPTRIIETVKDENKSALEILQSVAELKTIPAGPGAAIVIAIDGVEGKRGDMAWYYKVDGKKPQKLASSYVIGNAKSMRWEYKSDVCSETVDK